MEVSDSQLRWGQQTGRRLPVRAEDYYDSDRTAQRLQEWNDIMAEEDLLVREVRMVEFLNGAVTMLTEAKEQVQRELETIERADSHKGGFFKRLSAKDLFELPKFLVAIGVGASLGVQLGNLLT